MHQMHPDPTSQSARLFKRAQSVIRGGSSRATAFFSPPHRVFAAPGYRSRAWGVNGVERIEYLNHCSSPIHGGPEGSS